MVPPAATSPCARPRGPGPSEGCRRAIPDTPARQLSDRVGERARNTTLDPPVRARRLASRLGRAPAELKGGARRAIRDAPVAPHRPLLGLGRKGPRGRGLERADGAARALGMSPYRGRPAGPFARASLITLLVAAFCTSLAAGPPQRDPPRRPVARLGQEEVRKSDLPFAPKQVET